MHFADVPWMLARLVFGSLGHVQNETAHECVKMSLRLRTRRCVELRVTVGTC